MALAHELDRGKYFMHNNEIFQVNRKEVVAYGTHSHTKLKLHIQALSGGGEKLINLSHNFLNLVEGISQPLEVLQPQLGF